ncbi:MAG: flagellar basal body rod protein FlgB [Planctomycetota bacterium]|nr:flagellar basal body rod protein FlgB [Planctomycetota bacterium]
MDISSANKDLLLHLMTASTMRAKVLAGNVANQNTPGYKRREVAFEDQLAQEIKRGASVQDLVKLDPVVSIDENAEAREDGNTVDMESEVSASRENRVLYELYAAMLRGGSRLTEIAVRSER